MEALRGQRVPGYSGATNAEFVGGSITDKQAAEMASRAAARHAARELAKGAGVRGASALPTRDADKLAADSLPVLDGTGQGATLDGDTGALVVPEEPKRRGNPAWAKGQANGHLATLRAQKEMGTESNGQPNAVTKMGTESNALNLVQNQLFSVGAAMSAVPDAISFVAKVVRGRVKPNAGRLGACYDLLNRCGITHEAVDRLEKLRAAPGGGVDLANLAGHLARAADLANRKKTAETVQINGQNTGKTGAE